MAVRIGIPRALGYYYLYPFYKTLLNRLGAEVIVSPETTKATLDRMESCPTDEPCVAVKLYFAHAEALAASDIDYVFSPILVSLEKDNFCCPKFLGISDMVRNGLRLDDNRILAPRIDHRLDPDETRKLFINLAARLNVTDIGIIHRALRDADHAQRETEELMVSRRLTVPEAFRLVDAGDRVVSGNSMGIDGRVEGQRPSPVNLGLSNTHNPQSRIAVIGHPYILYEMLSHDMIDRLREFGEVMTAEMVTRHDAHAELRSIPEGHKMWSFEAHLLGAALYMLRQRLVDRIMLVGSFECGPESIVESYIEHEADRLGIPFLLLTLDEQTGEAGLLTRIEAFMDTAPACHPLVESGSPPATAISTQDTQVSSYRSAARNGEMVIGFPSMGFLDIAIRAALEDCGVTCLKNPRTSKKAIELGAELAPEFVCFPLTATLGQMRLMLERGANTLFMVGGKGRCRLGWYAQVEEQLLRRAGYEFDMVVLDSPVPLRSNWKGFRESLDRIMGGASLPKIIRAFYFGYRKLAAIDHAESVCHRMRAIERDKGTVDRVFDGFIRRIERATDMKTVKRETRDFAEAVIAIETEDTHPLKVRIVGEIWVVLEHFVNQEIEKMLASQDDMRVEVDRELSATRWFRKHILSDPALKAREHQVREAASRYLTEHVGGHGQESVGATVLAKEEGCDGVIHIFPFTCMPEIVAQNILVSASEELDIPLLTFIVSEQTGEAGIQTRVEAFLDVLEERRRHHAAARYQSV